MKTLSLALGVLTYQRPELLRDLLRSFMRQENSADFKIIVYDNDPSGSAEIVARDCVPAAQLRYLCTDKNFGSSGGFNALFSEALGEDVTHFFCCDDDIELTDCCILQLLEVARTRPQAVILGGRRYISGKEFPWAPIINPDDVTRVSAHRHVADESVLVDTITFEGCLLPLDVMHAVDLPYRNFYMDGDDWDYGLRIRKAGYEILRIPETTIVRKIEPKQQLKRLPIIGLASWRSGIGPERTYYEVRNKFTIIRRHTGKQFSAFLIETARSLRRLLGVMLFDDHKLLRSRLILQAISHGWKCIEGRNSELRL